MTNRSDTTEQLIRLNQVLVLIPVAKSTWWEGVRVGKYPKPVKLGDRITCWRLEDIHELARKGV